MSLWAAEVEKSKFSPEMEPRRKRGVLETFLAGGSSGRGGGGGLKSKVKVKQVARPHSGIDQYDFPNRFRYQDDVQVRQAQRSDPRIQRGGNSEPRSRPQGQPRRPQEDSSRPPRPRARPHINISVPPAMPPETASSRANIDQIANLIIQKSQLEYEMKERESRYAELLNESQNLTKAMRLERDSARQELTTLQTTMLKESTLKQDPILPASRFTQPELDVLFAPHHDFHFKEQFRQLEVMIRNLVLDAMKGQTDAIRMVDLNPSMEFYIDRHGLNQLTVFGIRDVRCIVCRGFIMEFLLERVFRVFLFGMPQSLAFKEGFQALSALDIGRGSKWAATVAKVLIAANSDYDPEHAATETMTELKIYLKDLMDLNHIDGLGQVVMKAVEVARDCRLENASFALEMPSTGTKWDERRMDAAEFETGNVAVTYSPIVTKRGNRRGEEYQHGSVLIKGKCVRESVFSELKNLRTDPMDTFDD